MAHHEMGILMQEPAKDFLRPYDEPSGPEEHPGKRPRAGKWFIAFTYGVIVFAALWIIATIFAPDIHASKLTFIGFLACLIFFAGEYIGWERPRIPKRKAKHYRDPWRDRNS